MNNVSRLPEVSFPMLQIVSGSSSTLARELDGSNGRLRGDPERCMLDASNDWEAIDLWVTAKGRSAGAESHTKRAYRREAERLLLWAVFERRKALSSLTHADCQAYLRFLQDPQPAVRWCGPRGRKRGSSGWRPFEGPLSVAARRQAQVILGNLFRFLNEMHYMQGNPFCGMAFPRSSQPGIDPCRSFAVSQWQEIRRALDSLQPRQSGMRLKFAVLFLYGSGLRLSELVSARLADLTVHGERSAVIRVTGKGGRECWVPVSGDLVLALKKYLVSRGIDADAVGWFASPCLLIGHADGRKADCVPVMPATLYKSLKTFFVSVGHQLAQSGKLADATHLHSASTHWLRHTHASHAVSAGLPLHMVRENLGHASLTTTTVYVKSELEQRIEATTRLRWPAGADFAPDTQVA